VFPIIACVPPDTGGGSVPTEGPASVTFSDQDPSSLVAGAVSIGRATDESDVTFYDIHFGTSDCQVAGTQIAQIIRAGAGEVIYDMPSTPIPPGADHILAFTKNLTGQNPNCVSTPINNNQPLPSPPTEDATAVSFTDIDLNLTVGGPINVTRAIDETTITHYVLRWGGVNHCNIAGGGFITQLVKTGSDLVYTLAPGTNVPAGAEEILVYTKNDFFESTDCDNVYTPLANNTGPKVPPTVTADGVSFIDTDVQDTIGGTVIIDIADNEPTITAYVIRWGDDSHMNVGTSIIAELAVTGEDLIYQIPQGTVVPNGATEILVYSKNAYGTMPNGNNVFTSINNNTPIPTVQITYSNNGECLIAKNGTGPRINGASCAVNSPAQRWQITPNGSDAGGPTYQIKNVATGLCVKDLGQNNPNQSWLFLVEFFFELTPCGGSYQSFNIYHQSGNGSDEWFIRNKARNACFYRWSGFNNFDVYAAGGNCNWASWGYPYMKFGFQNLSGIEVNPPDFR